MSPKQQLVFDFLLQALADHYGTEINRHALIDFLSPMSDACLDAVLAYPPHHTYCLGGDSKRICELYSYDESNEDGSITVKVMTGFADWLGPRLVFGIPLSDLSVVEGAQQ